MPLLKPYILTIIVFGISHCVLETSGTSLYASLKEPIGTMRSRDNRNVRNKEIDNEDWPQTNVHGFIFKKGPAGTKNDKNTLFQNLPSSISKFQSRLRRTKRSFDDDKKRAKTNLLKELSNMESTATTNILATSVVHDSIKTQQAQVFTQTVSGDNYSRKKVMPQKRLTATDASQKDESGQTISTTLRSYFMSDEPGSDETHNVSETFNEKYEPIIKNSNNYSSSLSSINTASRPMLTGFSELVEDSHYEDTDNSTSTFSFLHNNTPIDEMTLNQHLSDETPFSGKMNTSNWTPQSHPKQKSNLTMLDVARHKNMNTSSALLSSMTTPRRLYFEKESTLSIKQYVSDPKKRKMKNQDKAETYDQHSRRYKTHESVNSDQQQTSSKILPSSPDISNRFLDIKTKLSNENLKENKVVETDDELKSEPKGDSHEVEDDKINDREGNDSSDCPTCVKSGLTEEEVKLIRLNMFKDLLAQKLRINPVDLNMEGVQSDGRTEDHKPKLPQSIVEQTIKDNAQELDKDQFYARDQEIIIAGEDIGRECIKAHVTGCYSFSLKDKIKLEVTEAQLWVYKNNDANDIKAQSLVVSQLERRKSGNLVNGSVIAREDTFSKEGWISINITKVLLQWVDMKKDTEMLAIRCSTCAARSHKSVFGAKLGYTPLLVVKYATSVPIVRTKRTVCDPRVECCKRDLTVNFHDISMTEIYEPRNLSIGYCYGGCNEIHQYTYNHTALKQRLRFSSSYVNHPTMNQQLKPCCVPLVLKDTFLMTVEGNEYIRKVVPKVIVATCGCM